uniref:Uncharacterized protein n=1 Tax=Rhizophagus irregularis (strain DAOM 181602 / DAOM 197198 / MUCL 43194) TaxID=747089 RepID=U9UNZ2_RHIID
MNPSMIFLWDQMEQLLLPIVLKTYILEVTLIHGSYYNNVYSLEILDRGTYYQISCAFHDKSLWFIGSGHYIYLYINNYKNFNKAETFPFPDTTGIAKIDVGQRDDLWILTEDYELYHWDEIKRKFIHRTESYGTSFYDFSVGPDGSVVFSYYDIFTY